MSRHDRLHTSTTHFRYCTIRSSRSTFTLSFDGSNYDGRLSDPNARGDFGSLSLTRQDGSLSPGPCLSRWLSLYLGEECGNLAAKRDARFRWTRGVFVLDFDDLNRFLTQVEAFPSSSQPKWTHEPFDLALSHYCGALRAGHHSFPSPQVSFATCVEVIQNLHLKNRTDRDFKKLGTGAIKHLVEDRLPGPKWRDFRKKIFMKDVDLLAAVRSQTGAHSFLHTEKGDRRVRGALRAWYERNGAELHAESMADRSLRDELALRADGLFKLGLRLARTALFYYLRDEQDVPFASHDWQIAGAVDGLDIEIPTP